MRICRIITPMLVFAALTGCGSSGGGSANGGDDNPFLPAAPIEVTVVPGDKLLLQRGESERVRLFTSEPTALGVDFSEQDTGIFIDTGPCVPASDLCHEWTIRPGRDAFPGDHVIPVLVGAELDVTIDDANAFIALTVFPADATAPLGADGGPISIPSSAGFAHLVLEPSGTVFGWGADDGVLGAKPGRPPAGNAGAPFRHEGLPRSTPGLPAGGVERILALAVGSNHALALGLDGSLWTWGANGSGQLGNGNREDDFTPSRVLSGFRAVAAGFSHSVAVDGDGQVWAWGENGDGQLGSAWPPVTDAVEPVQVPGFTRPVVQVAAGGGHTLALDAGGTVWAWGRNGDGQLGDGSTEDRADPVQVLTDAVAISAGTSHSVALSRDGIVWAWGDNARGQLGDGTTEDRLAPVAVSPLFGMVAVAAGGKHTLALSQDGGVWAWGSNLSGEVGDGTYERRLAPVRVLTGARGIAAGADFSLAAVAECGGALRAWGTNFRGNLGLGLSGGDSPRPVPVAGIGEAGDCGNERRLMIYLTGGDGTVTSPSVDLECPPRLRFCWASVPLGAMVELAATPTIAGEFDGWHWDCADASSTTTLIVDGHEYCKVKFAGRSAALVVEVAGNGRVTSDPAGIACPTDCDETFDVAPEPRNVTLTAVADPGWRFSSWSGACSGTAASADVLVSADLICVARFDEIDSGLRRLTIARDGTGTGTVTSAPPGIACGADCGEDYPIETVVTLTAVPDPGSMFAGWAGDQACPSGAAATGTVEVTASTHCIAVFDGGDGEPANVTLIVRIDEIVGQAFTVTGSVTTSPPGVPPIACGPAESGVCSAEFPRGTAVTLIGTPMDDRGVLRGWNGDPDCADGTVTLDEPKLCEAVFDSSASSARAELTVAVNGEGTVGSSDGAILCPDDCVEIYDFNETVVLGANPAAGQTLVAWGGGCAGRGSGLSLQLDLLADTSCTATFGPTSADLMLTVSVAGPGSVRVFLGASVVLECASNAGLCSIPVTQGEEYVLVWLDSGPGQRFDGWGGDCAGLPGSGLTSLPLAIDGSYACTAMSR